MKEWGRLVDVLKSPTPEQIAASEGLDQGPFRLRTDRRGYIENGNDRLPNAEEIVCLGDSFLECMFVEEQGRLCAIVERELRASGVAVNILNGGASGATSLTLFNLLINKCVVDTPRAVVLFGGVMDIDAVMNPDSYWGSQQFITPLIDPDASPPKHPLAEPHWRPRTRIFQMYRAASEAFGFTLIFATFAHRKRTGEFMQKVTEEWWFDAKYALRRRANENMRGFALDNGIPLLDIEVKFEDPGSLLYDDIHLGKVGTEHVGALVASRLRDILYR